MNRDLRQHISETYDASAWERITGIQWQNGTPWYLWKFEQDVERDGELWRCVIVERVYLDPDDLEAVDHADDVLAEAWEMHTR